MVTLIPAAAAAPAGLGVVIALHGSGGSPATLAPTMARAMSRARVTRFAVICVDGGETYWHQRADGDDPAGMIVHEVLPRAAAAGLHTRRIGIAGLSMGGYGALLIAEQFTAEQPRTLQLGHHEYLSTSGEPGGGPAVAAVAALSPAVFASYADARAANAAAFDSAADFARNDVVSALAPLRRVPAFIACGTDDPFQPEVALVRSRLAALTHHRRAGRDHARVPRQLLLGAALARRPGIRGRASIRGILSRGLVAGRDGAFSDFVTRIGIDDGHRVQPDPFGDPGEQYVLRGQVPLHVRHLMQGRARVVECRLGALIRRGRLHVLAHHDDRQQDQLQEGLRHPGDDRGRPGPDRIRQADQVEQCERISAPHTAHDRGDERARLSC